MVELIVLYIIATCIYEAIKAHNRRKKEHEKKEKRREV